MIFKNLTLFCVLLSFVLTACDSKVTVQKNDQETSADSKGVASSESNSTPKNNNASLRPQNSKDCQLDGALIPNGESRKVFKDQKIECNSACQEGTVTCKEGVLSGNTDFKALSCSQICNCQMPWGTLFQKDTETVAFKKDVLECDAPINCNDESNQITVKCVNPFKNEIQVTKGGGQIQDFQKRNCAKKVCACFHLGVFIKPTDPPLPVYKSKSVKAPAKCEDNANMGKVTCELSNGSYLVRGDNSISNFPYASCAVESTTTGSGNSDSTVGAGDGGGKGGGLGNDEGEGEGFRRRGKGGGGSCGPGCMEAVDTAPYALLCGNDARFYGVGGMCFTPNENGYPAPPQPGGKELGNRVTPGTYMYAYSVNQVGCNDKCSNYLGLTQCAAGEMSSKTKYKYLDCKEVCP